MKPPYYAVFTLALCVIFNSACTKIEKKENAVHDYTSVSLSQAEYKNPYGVLINKSKGIPRTDSGDVRLAKALGVQYVRLTVNSGNWNDAAQRQIFLNTYRSFVASDPPLQILLNINWRSAKGTVAFPGASEEYKTYIKDVLDTLTSGRYAAPGLVVIENEENNTNFHIITTVNDIDLYLAELRYAVQLCKARNIKVCNAGITSLGMHLLVWDYYKSVLQDSVAADAFLHKVLPPESVIDFNSKKFQKKLRIVNHLMDAYANIDMDYFNFHWYEPVQALYWLDPTPTHSIDTNHISPGVLEEVLHYLKYNAPIAGKVIITNETGQVATSPEIPKEVTCALQDFPVVSWYSGDGGEDDDNRLYRAVALHTSLLGYPGYALRANGLAFKSNIANIIADPDNYCLPFSK